MQAVLTYDFCGNVRDLENVIVRALVLAEPCGMIGLDDLPGIPAATAVAASAPSEHSDELVCDPLTSQTSNLLAAVERFERQQIERALAAANGNRARAARSLGISRRWPLKKLERYGVLPALVEE